MDTDTSSSTPTWKASRTTLAVGCALLLAMACNDPPEEGGAAGECTDGADNDDDGLVDCADRGCEDDPACADGDAGGMVGRDGGMDAGRFDAGPRDAGAIVPSLLADTCASGAGDVISSTTEVLEVDTRALTSAVSSCGGVSAPGNDGFVALDLEAGDVWHFHVAVAPSETSARDPIAYLLDDGCATGVCANRADVCAGGGDEHFTVTVAVSGRYYLGVDDRQPGGATYHVSAIRTECGNGVLDHGEACDGTDDCTAECRRAIQGPDAVEVEVNDNFQEANQIVVGATPLRIRGSVGGAMCVQKDVFTFASTAAMGTLEVRSLDAAGVACASGAATPFDLVLRNVAGGVAAQAMTDSSGCASLDVSDLNAGRYFLEVIPDSGDVPVDYHLELTLEAP